MAASQPRLRCELQIRGIVGTGFELELARQLRSFTHALDSQHRRMKCLLRELRRSQRLARPPARQAPPPGKVCPIVVVVFVVVFENDQNKHDGDERPRVRCQLRLSVCDAAAELTMASFTTFTCSRSRGASERTYLISSRLVEACHEEMAPTGCATLAVRFWRS